jgi:hypothetical protein
VSVRGPLPGFQSSLPVAGERVIVGKYFSGDSQDVSILAPRCRGACPRRAAGEQRRGRLVSILAPRCRGACRPPWHRPFAERCFNPRSPLPGSVSRRQRRRGLRCCRFNPRSPLPGSVSGTPAGGGPAGSHCFNPRSPLPGSVSGPGGLRPRTCRFNPRSPLPGSVSNADRFYRRTISFQSSLPVAGERVQGAAAGSFRALVSILAPRRRGACPLASKCLYRQRFLIAFREPRRERGTAFKTEETPQLLSLEKQQRAKPRDPPAHSWHAGGSRGAAAESTPPAAHHSRVRESARIRALRNHGSRPADRCADNPLRP